MTEAQIKAIFGIDRTSSISLKEQLQSRLQSFVNMSQPGTILPSERSLHQILGLSRQTIRSAFLPLQQEGIILRNPHQGSFIAPVPSNTLFPDFIKKVTFNNGSPNTTVQETITLLIYENLAHQQNFWKYTVHFFNALHPDKKIKIHFFPPSIPYRHYCNYINEIQPDLIQYGSNVDIDRYIRPISPELHQFLTHGEFYVNPRLSSKKLPYAFSTPLTFWNEDLSQKYEMTNIRERLRQGKYLEILAEARTKIPEKSPVSGHLWDYLTYTYMGRNPQTIKREILKNCLEKIQNLQDFQDFFSVKATDAFDAARKFCHGEEFILDTYPSTWHAHSHICNFKMECEPFPLPKRSSRIIFPHYLGISQHSRHTKTCEEFLLYMLSESVQRLLLTRLLLIPRKISAWYYGAGQIFAMSKSMANMLMRQFHPCDFSELAYFLVYIIQDDLADFTEKKIALNLILDQIMQKWEQYLPCINSGKTSE